MHGFEILMTNSRPFRLLLLIGVAFWLTATAYTETLTIDCDLQNVHSACVTTQTPDPIPVPSTPEQLPPAPPKVTYKYDQLTINAQNSRLGDVLHAISARTGTVIDFPPDRAGERIFVNIGPSPMREVLVTLLNGSRYNYVMLGSADDPSSLQRMVLTNADQTAQPALPAQTFSPPPTPALSEVTAPAAPAAAEEQAINIHVDPPAEPLPPEVVGQMMRQLGQQIREQQQQQQQPPQPSSQPRP